MKKLISVILAATLMLLPLTVCSSAYEPGDERIMEMYSDFLNLRITGFDVNGDGALSAADAREILLNSAGLANNINTEIADVDGDGAVTAIDARAALRVSAQLDSAYDYHLDKQLELFNTMINSIKQEHYGFFSTTKEYTDDVTYDNHALTDSIDKQMNELMGKLGEDEKLNISEDLTAEKGKQRYSNTKTSTLNTIEEHNYPLSGQSATSLLLQDNVTRIAHAEGESFALSVYNTAGTNTWKTNTLEGLASITVYVKSDSMADIPEDLSVFNHSKAFDLLSNDAIEEAMGNAGALGSLDMGDLSSISEDIRMDVSIDFSGIDYYDSYVKIYFNPATGIPVATEHSMHYNLLLKMDMDLYVPNIAGLVTGWDVGKPYLEAKGTLNMVHTVTNTQYYCFHSADSAYPIQFTRVY